VRIAVLTIGCAIGLVVFGVALLPEGEVATLSTFGADGTQHQTQVWVVDGNGSSGGSHGEIFLRTGPRTRWLARLRARPEVELERGGETHAYRAVVEEAPEVRERVNRAMAEKYGFPNRLLGRIYDPASSVPVRLVPDSKRKPAQADDAPH
jgi:hypothetical protein